MATLTTSYQKLGETYLGNSYGNLYIRIYSKYSERDITNNRTKVQYQARAYFSGNYILDQQSSGNVKGTSASQVNYSKSSNYTNGETTLGTTEAWVYHNNDGTKSISCSAYLNFPNWGWNGTASGSANLPTIPRQATITNSPTSFTDEENPWFTFSNPANATLSCWLEPYPNGTHYCTRTLSGTSGTFTWTLTEEERNQLRSSLANATNSQATCRIGLYSTIGGTTYASYVDRTLTIVNANPIFTSSDMEYSDLGGEALVGHITTNLTGDDSKIIKGYSHLAVLISGDAVAQKEATISYYQLENIKKSFEDTDIKIIDIENYNKDTITIYAVDSRNNSTSITTNISDFINYSDMVKGSISLDRNDNGTSEFVTLNYSGEFWNGNFGARNNSLTATYKFKKTSDTTYTTGTTTITPTTNNNNFSFNGLIAGDTENHGFDRDEVYEVIVEVSDCLSKVTYNALINAGTPAIAIYGNKASIGGKYDTSLGGIQLWGDIYVNGNRIS